VEHGSIGLPQAHSHENCYHNYLPKQSGESHLVKTKTLLVADFERDNAKSEIIQLAGAKQAPCPKHAFKGFTGSFRQQLWIRALKIQPNNK